MTYQLQNTTKSLDVTLRALEFLGQEDLMILPQTPSPYMCRVTAEICGIDPFTAKRVYQIMQACALDEFFGS